MTGIRDIGGGVLPYPDRLDSGWGLLYTLAHSYTCRIPGHWYRSGDPNTGYQRHTHLHLKNIVTLPLNPYS